MKLLENLRTLFAGPTGDQTITLEVEQAPHEMDVVFTSTKKCILTPADAGMTMLAKVQSVFGNSDLSNVEMYIVWENGDTLSGTAAKDYKIDPNNFPIKVTLGSSHASNG